MCIESYAQQEKTKEATSLAMQRSTKKWEIAKRGKISVKTKQRWEVRRRNGLVGSICCTKLSYWERLKRPVTYRGYFDFFFPFCYLRHMPVDRLKSISLYYTTVPYTSLGLLNLHYAKQQKSKKPGSDNLKTSMIRRLIYSTRLRVQSTTLSWGKDQYNH